MGPESPEPAELARKAIVTLLSGGVPDPVPVRPGDDDGLSGLLRTINELIERFQEAREFITALSQGRLETEPPLRNYLISPFKQLHSRLAHLTWQTMQVARGDLNQRVDFLGEFSDAFNSMISSLQEKRRLEQELVKAHGLLLEANTNILDSIHYARTIQTAFLPLHQEMASGLTDYFVLWKPRDVIGGDFYKFRSVPGGFLIAVMDCTGHGVPGAIITMIAGSCFDRAVEDVGHEDPARILTRLDWLVKLALSQHREEALADDGLDIGICSVNRTLGRLVYAGARIDLYCGRSGRIHEVRADPQSVGYKASKRRITFRNHEIPVDTDTRFYLVTDGITSQTGGSKGLPMGRTRFVQLLQKCRTKPLSGQHQYLEDAVQHYRGQRPQLDDMTLLGFIP